MLTLTDNASTVVEAIVRRNDETEHAGLRIEAENPDATDFGVTIVPLPEPRDAIVEQGGARVYLDESATTALSDKTLDASVDEKGRVAFNILPQV